MKPNAQAKLVEYDESNKMLHIQIPFDVSKYLEDEKYYGKIYPNREYGMMEEILVPNEIVEDKFESIVTGVQSLASNSTAYFKLEISCFEKEKNKLKILLSNGNHFFVNNDYLYRIIEILSE